jgi:serine/threonine protein kinase
MHYDPLPLPPMPQVVAGLLHYHSQGVWHLDIKPDNILVSHEGAAKVADFGTASLHQWIPPTQCCGTLEYACPEALQARRQDGVALTGSP